MVSGIPDKTVRLVVGGIERGAQTLNADGATVFSFATAYLAVLHAPATIQYIEGDHLGPEYTVYLWGPPSAF